MQRLPDFNLDSPEPNYFGEEFIGTFTDENKDLFAIDFDGVIHKSSKGYYDGTIYDEPVIGVEDALRELSKNNSIIIFKKSPISLFRSAATVLYNRTK